MKNSITLTFLASFLAMVQVSFSQTVEEIIKMHIEVRGGKDKLAAVKTIAMDGSEKHAEYYSIAFTTVMEQDKLFRTDVRVMGRRGFVLRKPAEGNAGYENWKYDPLYMDKPGKLNDTSIVGKRSQQAPIDIIGGLFNYDLKGHRVALIGKDSVKGQECYLVKLTLKDGSADAYWIDAKTYLIVQKQNVGLVQSNGAYLEVNGPLESFSNYRAVDGVLFPFSVTQLFKTANGITRLDTYYTNIEINKPINPKFYQPKRNKKL